MKTRVISAVVGLAIVVAVLVAGQLIHPMIASGALAVVTVMMTSEALNAKKLMRVWPISSLCLLVSLVVPMVSHIRYWFIAYFLYMVAMLCVMVFMHEHIKLGSIAYSFFLTTVITTGMSTITTLVNSNPGYCAFFVVLAIATPWIADAGAYFVGVKFGKHKLCPKISPKKTVEGAVGGCLAGCLSAVVIGLLFQLIFGYAYMNYLSLAIIGIINTPLSMVGDLSFSIIKRQLGIKDYGNIIPGHGGMMDRFDSVVVTAPLVYIVSMFGSIVF